MLLFALPCAVLTKAEFKLREGLFSHIESLNDVSQQDKAGKGVKVGVMPAFLGA